MAEQTGGLAILNANDPTPGLEKIADDFETYYSLGYRLIPSGQDRMHHIQVKVKGHSEYRLSYRKTFIEKTLPTRIGDRVVSGLTFDLEDNPLGIELATGVPAPADNERWTLPVEVRIPLDKVALIPEGEDLIGYLMVYYAARDDEGKQSDLQRTEHPIRMPASRYETARRQFFTVTASLLLEPGRYRISVGRARRAHQPGRLRSRTSGRTPGVAVTGVTAPRCVPCNGSRHARGTRRSAGSACRRWGGRAADAHSRPCGPGRRHPRPGLGTVQGQVADVLLLTRIRVALLERLKEEGMRVTIEVHGGSVDLSGQVERRENVELAERVAASVNGVRTVRSRVTLGPQRPGPGTADCPRSGQGGACGRRRPARGEGQSTPSRGARQGGLRHRGRGHRRRS